MRAADRAESIFRKTTIGLSRGAFRTAFAGLFRRAARVRFVLTSFAAAKIGDQSRAGWGSGSV